MVASAPVRHYVICNKAIPEARLLVRPKTITYSPEHSSRHKQNLINALKDVHEHLYRGWLLGPKRKQAGSVSSASQRPTAGAIQERS